MCGRPCYAVCNLRNSQCAALLAGPVCRYECADGSIITAYFKPARAAAAAAEEPAASPQCIAVKARLLVAADGYFSRVRRQCLADGPPEVCHTCVERGTVFPEFPRAEQSNAVSLVHTRIVCILHVQHTGAVCLRRPCIGTLTQRTWLVNAHSASSGSMFWYPPPLPHLNTRAAACPALQYGDTLVYRARLPASAAAAAGVDMLQSSMFVQDVGRFVFAYPISSGDVVWTVGVQGGLNSLQGCSAESLRSCVLLCFLISPEVVL